MNNIYVDELPKNCEKCPCYSYSEGFCNCECWYQKYGEIKDVAEYTQFGLKENERPADCPLKPLSDRLAEERKKVVQEIWEEFESYFESSNLKWEDKMIVGKVCNMINEILDQVREVK